MYHLTALLSFDGLNTFHLNNIMQANPQLSASVLTSRAANHVSKGLSHKPLFKFISIVTDTSNLLSPVHVTMCELFPVPCLRSFPLPSTDQPNQTPGQCFMLRVTMPGVMTSKNTSSGKSVYKKHSII